MALGAGGTSGTTATKKVFAEVTGKTSVHIYPQALLDKGLKVKSYIL